MAKVLVAFFNAMNVPENPNAMPVFYEAFIEGLDKAGNEVAVFSHSLFGLDFGEIDEDTKQAIVAFNPDICFVFNNSFYDLANVVHCPIVIYEVDSPRYYSNKENIRNKPDRYIYFVVQQESVKTLIEEYNISENRIFCIPFFTEIYSDDSVVQTTNISFIGSLFADNCCGVMQYFLNQAPSIEERQMMRRCLQELKVNPQITPTELVYRCQITSEKVARCLDLKQLLMILSGERRIALLASLEELGLDLYGTNGWGSKYYYNTALNLVYNDKQVYSIKHNQDIYNASKIGISVSHYQAVSGFPWRVMDVMASNACLVSDYHSDFKDLFGNVPVPIYSSDREAYDICKQLLEDESRRRDIVLQCQDVINAKYRFKHLLPKFEEYSGVVMHT